MYNFFLIYKVFHIFVVTFLHKFMKKYIGLFIIWSVIFPSAISLAQEEKNQEKQADLLHKKYEFEQALNIYNRLLEQNTDSLQRIELENKIIQVENGLSLLDFVSEPYVVAKQKYGKKEFFLHYPGFADSSWVHISDSLAPGTQNSAFPVMYFPKGARHIFFSAPDNSGSWNVYTSSLLNDTLWSAPRLLNENITSVGNEFFPVLSADGKSLYFSSNGHSGVGGYDLYVSNWDEEISDWGIPQNMGFPYSSPEDDFLFYNTPDGLYSVFASNRSCSGDSLVVYAMSFENLPLKKSVTPQEALKIASLPLSVDNNKSEKGEKKKVEADKTEGILDLGKEAEYSQYALAVDKVRKLQQKLTEAIKRQKANRELYNTLTNPDDLVALEKKITEQEVETLALQDEAGAAARQMQNLEMEFLSKGIFIPQVEELDQSAEGQRNESAVEMSGFSFVNNQLGKTPLLMVEQVEPEVDLSFKIMETESVLLGIDDFPDGLVYQIQLFTLSRPVTVKALKKLSPVFERKISGGRYLYSVGIFRTYDDVLANINKVKKRGFNSATIAAYNDGKAIAVKNARILEKEKEKSAAYQVVIDGYTDALPSEVLTVIRSTTEKDLAKTADGGRVKFVIGPFNKEEEARQLVTALKVVSDKVIEVEQVSK